MAAIERQASNPKRIPDKRLAAEALLQKVARNQTPALTLTAESLLEWDGNCWFRALLFYLRLQKRDRQENEEPWNVKALRAEVYNYIYKQKATFFPMFINYDRQREDVPMDDLFTTDNRYLRDSTNYSTNSTMGDLVPLAISMRFSMRITIIHHQGQVVLVGHEDNRYRMYVGRIELPDVQHVHALILM